MGKSRSKIAAQLLLETDVAYQRLLKDYGYQPAGETALGGVEYSAENGSGVVYDKNGWTATADGKEVDFGSGPNDLEKFLSQSHGAPTKQYPEGYVPPMSEGDKVSLRGLGVVSKLIARKLKTSGRPPRFSFSVPAEAADKVAFHLAKAGMDDFDVLEMGQQESLFVFKNEPELHVAEEIVKSEFADQITHRKGAWSMWAPQQEDPSQVTEIEMEGKPMMSSDKTADLTQEDLDRMYAESQQSYDPDRELEEEGRQDRELHEEMAQRETGFDQAVEEALNALYKLYNIESSTDIMELARMTAGDLRQFVAEYKAGTARKFSYATGKRCQGCAKVLPDVKDRVVKAASEMIEATLCEGCGINLAKEL